MSIANFFDKVSLGAAQVLKNYDRKKFEALLLSQSICISFDQNGSQTSEGKATLDLLTRLLARLYPRIQFRGEENLKAQLNNLALSINPQIDLSSCDPTINIVVGVTKSKLSIPTMYIGSSEWNCKFSCSNPMGSHDSGNPFGAGSAACMGAANIFRLIFKQQLPYSEIDSEFVLSLLDFKLTDDAKIGSIKEIDLGGLHLIGLGAIGNAVLWTFKNIEGLKAQITGIEYEDVSLSNLQRYVLTNQSSIRRQKTVVVDEYLSTSLINFVPFNCKLDKYISEQKHWLFERLAICVDNPEDRILAQGILPRKIFNAWTQHENLGVSRHVLFGDAPCLSCLYLNSIKRKHRSQEIADNLKLPTQEPLIRRYLANNYPMDTSLLNLVKEANNLTTTKELDQFLGRPLDIFYSEVVCGGVLLKGGNLMIENQNSIEVPSAFESAFAGILLAAELVKDKLNYFNEHPKSSIQFNLIRSLSQYLLFPESIKENCMCQDEDFLIAYRSKWNTDSKSVTKLNLN